MSWSLERRRRDTADYRFRRRGAKRWHGRYCPPSTDATQMAVGVAEALLERGEIAEDVLCPNYVPSRGYGRGARAVLEAMEEGPVGLLFRDDHARLWEQARLSALPTHVHPQGIEGAQLLALAVALCSRMEQFDRSGFFAALLAAWGSCSRYASAVGSSAWPLRRAGDMHACRNQS